MQAPFFFGIPFFGVSEFFFLMARPRKGSSKSLLTKASATIDDLLNDDKTPIEVRARLAVKVVEWNREDKKLENQQVELTAAREAELKQQGIQEYLASLSSAIDEAMRCEQQPANH